jgi:hypothetical protein
MKLFNERLSDKLSRNLLALDREKCKLITGTLCDHCAPRQHLQVIGLLESATYRNCKENEAY